MTTDYASKARALYQAVNLCNNFDEAVSAIATALREERERAAKIVMQHSDRFLRQFHEADTISLELGRVVAEVRSWATAVREGNSADD